MSNKKICLIAEIGINHNGDINLAKKLIDLAKKCDFDLVKFQKRTPDISTPENKKNVIRHTPWGDLSYLEYKHKIEFGEKEFDQIDRHCKKLKINWFCSAWDIPSLNFLKKYNNKYNKVASAMLTNLELLKKISAQKKITFISTGMSTYKDINNAIKIFKKNKCKFILMHSVSTYPCPENDLNLKMIPILKKKYRCEIGYSGHEVSVSPSIFAVAMGANYIERHITLDRTMWGTDQAASLEYNGMIQLSNLARKFERSVGNGIKKILPDEKKKLLDMKYW
jgi:N-acetylneuraminate synthase